MNPCKNCGARYVECGECGDDITSGIDHLIEDNKTSRAKVAALEAEVATNQDALRIAADCSLKLQGEVERLRGLCGQAAEVMETIAEMLYEDSMDSVGGRTEVRRMKKEGYNMAVKLAVEGSKAAQKEGGE